MKRILTLSVTIILCIAFSAAVFAMSHGDAADGCKYCGMDLKKFASTAMGIHYDDGTVVKVCSLHCAAIDLALNIDKTPESIKVGDFGTKEKIDAEAAYWVIDDKRPGVMTTRAKWAFEKKEDAMSYIKENWGTLVTFDDAIKEAYEDMYADTKMIRNKRKMMKNKMMQGGQGR